MTGLRWHRIEAVLAASLLAAGCMLGPDFRRPAAPVASKWVESDDAAVDVKRQEYRNWWMVFNDPVLTHLVQLAYQQNLTLRTAGARVLETRAQLGVAIGELYPQQQAIGASVTYSRLPISLPYNLSSNTYWSDIFSAQAAWELDVWGKLRRAIESADDTFLASVADYDDVLVSLTGDVANNYVQIRTAQKQIAIAQDNAKRQREALKIARAKFEGGTATKRDVYQAENVLGATEAVIPQLTIQVQESENALSVLLGLPPGQMDQLIAGPAGHIPTAPQRASVGIPADLLRRRPDVRRAELQAAAQCAQIGFAKADLLPLFSLTGNVGSLGSTVSRGLDSVFTGQSLYYAVGPTVQWNILNYGQITNNVRVQDAKFQELLISYQNSLLKAQQEVEDGIAVFLNSRVAVVYLKESVKAATGALRIALIQYREGIADFTTVLTAEENLYTAQNNLATAEGSVPLGLIAAYRALGGGWQIREGQDFVPAATREEMAERTNWGRLLSPELLQPKASGLPSPKDQGPLVRPPEW
ncbi:MAG TPA: efflux transporter outer membrane subunit [Candidatus Binataceae bacterium]|jgi:NodT family efflux transporter outer membrane factor (OMF) lipoprotein|nr:efflux transporter outer membrane subunit [Candidatus Binataceae bacterium]